MNGSTSFKLMFGIDEDWILPRSYKPVRVAAGTPSPFCSLCTALRGHFGFSWRDAMCQGICLWNASLMLVRHHAGVELFQIILKTIF